MTDMRWDLGALFSDVEELDRELERYKVDSEAFRAKYAGKLNAIESSGFLEALGEYERLLEGIGRVMSYAFLTFAEDTTRGDLYAKYELLCNSVSENLLFFEIEFLELEEGKRAQLVDFSSRYSYYLQKLIENKKHTLSLPEERVMLKLNPVGASAFSRLFDEHLSGLKFYIGDKEMGEEEVLSLLYHEKRTKRKKAAKALTKGLAPHKNLLAYILNVVRKENAILCELRGYASPEESRHIDNQISQKSVDAMIDCVNANMGIVAEFYELKREILGLKKLYDYDRYAPLASKGEQIDIVEAKESVLGTFSEFSQRFGEVATRAFNDGWIDSHPRENKRGGAFSHGTVPSAHPYVLLNHTNGRRDVFTLAHELGHAIHQELSKAVGYLNADTPLTTAETASVFAEMLLFDKIRGKLKKKERIALLAGKLEDIFATLFRQSVFTNFERRIHAESGELKPEHFDEIWLEENRKMFGDSVVLGDSYASWWSYIPHFVHSPFYCYAYSYGQLLVMALFGLYKRGDDGFVEKYEEFLSLGGSRSPKELVSIFGFDIEDSAFWEIGIEEVKKLLSEFKEVTKS